MTSLLEGPKGQEISIYDIEFIGLMEEINKRIDKFCKGDRLKINSWIECLMAPTKNIEWKKNRNLYAIVLIDSLINHKLNEPFNKFPKGNKELPLLSVTKVKSELSKKFFKEISSDQAEIVGMKIYKNKLNKENNNTNISKKSSVENSGNVIKHKTNNDNQNQVESNNEKDYKLDKFKLESLIQELSQINFQKDEIISKQNEEINLLKQNINELEKKVKIVMTHQAQHKQKNNQLKSKMNDNFI